mmetsp:Transcript_56307/g.132703  ORF Transcript_56307/g.132703 Transcript_56307/m.132703 type:complete len:339 (+) Transcript_56307:3-1019(+)
MVKRPGQEETAVVPVEEEPKRYRFAKNHVEQDSFQMPDHARCNMPRMQRDQQNLVLRAWLSAHQTNPYPTKDEKIQLSYQSGLSVTQVNHWFQNMRKRATHSARDGPKGKKTLEGITAPDPAQLAIIPNLSAALSVAFPPGATAASIPGANLGTNHAGLVAGVADAAGGTASTTTAGLLQMAAATAAGRRPDMLGVEGAAPTVSPDGATTTDAAAVAATTGAASAGVALPGTAGWPANMPVRPALSVTMPAGWVPGMFPTGVQGIQWRPRPGGGNPILAMPLSTAPGTVPAMPGANVGATEVGADVAETVPVMMPAAVSSTQPSVVTTVDGAAPQTKA